MYKYTVCNFLTVLCIEFYISLSFGSFISIRCRNILNNDHLELVNSVFQTCKINNIIIGDPVKYPLNAKH